MSTNGRILVINPNSTAAVTSGIDAAMAPLRMAGGPEIVCVDLPQGPPGIQTQRDVDFLIPHLCDRIIADGRSATPADAYVIACFSDPGLYSARESTDRPVIGISEAGMTAALNLGQRVGVIAILEGSIPRHTRYFRAMGISERIVGEIPVNLTVVELSNAEKTFGRMVTVGKQLRDDKGADVIVMGCAGMARYREPLEAELGIPVIDPSQCAVGLAMTVVRFGIGAKKSASQKSKAA